MEEEGKLLESWEDEDRSILVISLMFVTCHYLNELRDHNSND